MDGYTLWAFYDELEKMAFTLKPSIPEFLKMPRIAAKINPRNKVVRILTKEPKGAYGDTWYTPMLPKAAA